MKGDDCMNRIVRCLSTLLLSIIFLTNASFFKKKDPLYKFDDSNSYENRLVTEEQFLNQKIYVYDKYAESYFFSYPVKKYDPSKDQITDIDSGDVLPSNIFCYEKNLETNLWLETKNSNLYFLFDKLLLDQYWDLIIDEVELIININDLSHVFQISSGFYDAMKDAKNNTTSSVVALKINEFLNLPDNYSIQLKIVTELPIQNNPSKGTNSISSGYYFLYPYGENDTYAMDANTLSDYKVFLWAFTGTNTQVWNITVSVLNGYAVLKNVYNNMYLRWDLTNMNVTLDIGGVVGNRFTIDYYDSNCYTLKPWYSNKIVKYNSVSNYSNVCLTNASSTVLSTEKWTFVPVSTIGMAGSYRPEYSSTFRCYPYAMRLSISLNVPSLSSNYTVQEVAQNVVNDPALYANNRKARILESNMNYTSYIKNTEYRVAVRVGTNNPDYPGLHDYHFMEQLNDGSWAHKPAVNYSRNDILNPETDDWNQYANNILVREKFYDSVIIYLAISYI